MLEDTLPRGLGERLLSLRSFAPLAALPASELALVARLSRERDFQVGQTLATEGESVQAVLLVISGRAVTSRGGVPVDAVGAFDSVGLLPIAAGMPHPVTVVAVEPIHALEIDADLVDDVLDDDFGLFVRVLRLAATSARTRGGARLAAGVLGGSRAPESTPARTGDSTPPAVDLAGPMGAARRLLALREAPLFRTAPVDGLAAFAKRLELVSLPPGGTLELAGASCQLGVVVSGRVEVTHGGRVSTEQFSAVAGAAADAAAGDVVGALEALTPGSQPLLVRAVTEASLFRGAASDLLDVIEDHHAMGRRLIAEILAIGHAIART